MYGKPDFGSKKYKLAVFIDGCFWHGCKQCRNIPETNNEFWHKKIKRNMERDEEVTRELKSQGYTVIRFWEHQIKENLDSCVEKIEEHLK